MLGVMNRFFFLALFAAALSFGTARAAKVDASLIPDGNYTITVEKVIDASHISARMENGVEVDLKAAKATVNFSASTPSRIKVFMVQGEVVFFAKA